MAKIKRNLFILAVFGVLAAVFYPTVKKHYQKYLKPHVDLTHGIVGGFLRLQISGYYLYKFILPLVAIFIIVKIIKKRRLKKKLEEEQKKLEAMGGGEGKKTATSQPPLKPVQAKVEIEIIKPVESTQVSSEPPPPPVSPVTSSSNNNNNNSRLPEPGNFDEIGNRVHTYCKNWSTTTSVNPFDLSRSGFIYTGREDTVECLSCKGTLMEWKKEDNPVQSHLEYYPECKIAQKMLESGKLEEPSPAKERLEDILSALLVCERILKSTLAKEGQGKDGKRAQRQLAELKNRLDTTERTMHLVMKQMEAVSKCLAKTVADDPSLMEGPHMAEISETLKTMKA